MATVPEGVVASSVRASRILGSNGQQPAAIAGLTDNTGGVAGATVPAIPDPADAPVSADALRDDLVANALPGIRNGLASINAKLDAILAALRSVGGIAP